MQYNQKHDENDDSDNDEGFVINTVEIKQKEKPKIVLNSRQRPTDYQPRYINSNSLIRKQLPQIVNSLPLFPNEQPLASSRVSRKKEHESITKVQQTVFPNKHYQLIYQRSNKKSEYDAITTQNIVTLNSVVGYSAQNYSILKTWDLKDSQEELIFESRFQCGNLHSAYKSYSCPNHYILFLSNDTNSNGYNKWFYFAVKNRKKNVSYTFSIVNFRKNMAFFKQGMKPTRFSLKTQQLKGNGWGRVSNKVSMYRSKIGDDSEALLYNEHYTLTFQTTFEYQNDTTYFSLLPPYSYSKLMNFLTESSKRNEQRSEVKFCYSTIAFSLSNTQVPYVTISAREPSKKNIVILGRQHPGEIWSSYLVQSLINQLLKDSFPQRDWILKNFTFRIFPMVNIDGVIYGNFRCDLSGTDLNRCWKEPNKLLHPHIIAIKEQIRRLSTEEEVLGCLDMHAHSKDYNIFAYCCKPDSRNRLLPFLISKATNLFYFPYCTFGISKYKETTARAVIHEMSKSPDVLTIQSSFFANNNPLKVLAPSSFISFASALIIAMKHYYSKDKDSLEAEIQLPKVMAEVAEMRSKNRQKYSVKQESGSDSQPQIDEIAINEKIGKIIPQCTAVEEAFGLNNQKDKLQSMKPKKVVKMKKKQKRKVSLSKNSIAEEPSLTKVEKPPIILSKPRANSNTIHNFLDRALKKKDKQRQSIEYKKSYQIESQTTKYIMKSDRNQKNQSMQLERDRKTLNNFLNTQFRSTFKEKKKLKYMVEQIQDRKEDQFPMLCVLSDSKKEAHVQKMRRIHPTPAQKQKPVVRYQPTFVVNKKMDTMQRLRERQKKSSDLVSSLWKDTVPSIEDNPISHIFYG